ncbi:MAG: alkaline phosphatase family protein [Candidatus Eisenbacteria bacterium]|uniref:Alkaline phosphatase family protein n=1 Tax=Eiseniibacteriota bacterium TaxID=2212470 RepID=A0A948RUD1_UNCEI|nr:alkaline phosphatase family protein [Candidatus Eisenbacteria bacterium]MBU1949498.1 alkaline phosphatase family protein [Candidatus Eisenbacteria bacterium]MBU2689728.1 alkaline phosphatase family protein [Candidatus Eisenbacteria bacterium]
MQPNSHRILLVSIFCALLVAFSIGFMTGCGGGEKPKILVIGLDGATWSILDPWIEAGDLPNLAQFRSDAAWGDLSSIIPYLSPPAWTSAITGVNPGRHGIFDFQRRLPQGNIIITETAGNRKAAPIWKMLEGKGKRSAFINIPMTDPPEEMDGVMVSGFPHVDKVLYTYPPELEKELQGYILDEMEMNLVAGKEDSIRTHIRDVMEARWTAVQKIYQKEDWDLFWVVFTAVDRVQHMFWRFMDPLDARNEEDEVVRYRDVVHDLWVRMDAIIGEFLAMAGPQDYILFVSDHGFGPIRRELRVKPYIEQQTLSSVLRENSKEIYCLHPSDGERLYVRVKGRDPNALLTRERQLEIRDELKRVLDAAKDPLTGEAILSASYTKDSAFRGPYSDKGPDLTLIPSTGYYVVWEDLIRASLGEAGAETPEEAVGTVSFSLSGWHEMEGIYLLQGRDVAKGRQDRFNSRRHNLMDVTPTLLYLLGVEVPEGLDGAVMEGVLDPERLKVKPIRYGPAFEELFREDSPDTSGLMNLPYIGG